MNCAVVTITGGKKHRAKRALAGPSVFVANVGNGCSTAAGTDVVFPDPGQDIQYAGDASRRASPGGTCDGKQFAGGGATGGTGGGATGGTGGGTGDTGSSGGENPSNDAGSGGSSSSDTGSSSSSGSSGSSSSGGGGGGAGTGDTGTGGAGAGSGGAGAGAGDAGTGNDGSGGAGTGGADAGGAGSGNPGLLTQTAVVGAGSGFFTASPPPGGGAAGSQPTPSISPGIFLLLCGCKSEGYDTHRTPAFSPPPPTPQEPESNCACCERMAADMYFFALYRIGRHRRHGHDCVRWHGRAGLRVLEGAGVHLFGSVYTADGVHVGSGGVRSRGGGGLVMVRQACVAFHPPFI